MTGQGQGHCRKAGSGGSPGKDVGRGAEMSSPRLYGENSLQES